MHTDPTPLDRALAITGALFAWLPILATLLISAVFFAQTGQLRIDPLMPAEMFLGYLGGAALLLVPAIGLRIQRRELIGSILAAFLGLGGAQGLAMLLGLASGDQPAEGWRILVITSLLALYTTAVVSTGIVGIRIVRRTLQRTGPRTP